MSRKGTLTVKVVGDSKNFEQTMSGLGGKAASAGKAIALGLAAGAAGAFMLGKEVLSTGGKLESFRQKTATVFEGSAGAIRKWADENNEIFGVTDDQLAGMAANFGDLLKPMGFTSEQAAEMSKEVVGLSGALSEWSGGTRDAAEVSTILSKAMLGEREGLKELGISITEAEVSGRLLEKGQKDLTGAALQQAKAIATQELLFEKSTDAQKAYAEGGNKALRSQNRLKAMFGELREQLAEKLLPVAMAVADWAAKMLPQALATASTAFQRIRPHLIEAGEVIKGVGESLADLAKKLADNKPLLIGVTAAIATGLVAAFLSWAASAAAAAAATAAAMAPILAIGVAIAALVAGIIWAYQNWEAFRKVVDSTAKFLTGTAWPAIKKVADVVKDSLVVAFEKASEAGEWLWQEVLEPTFDWIQSTLFPIAQTLVSTHFAAIKLGFEVVADAALWLWRNALQPAFSWVQSNLFPIISTLTGAQLGGLRVAFDGVGGALSWVWNNVLKPVGTWLISTFQGQVGAISAAFGSFKSAVDKIAGFGSTAFNGLASAIEALIGPLSKVVGWAQDAYSWIKSTLGLSASSLGSVAIAAGQSVAAAGGNQNRTGGPTRHAGGRVNSDLMYRIGRPGHEELFQPDRPGFIHSGVATERMMRDGGSRAASQTPTFTFNGPVTFGSEETIPEWDFWYRSQMAGG